MFSFDQETALQYILEGLNSFAYFGGLTALHTLGAKQLCILWGAKQLCIRWGLNCWVHQFFCCCEFQKDEYGVCLPRVLEEENIFFFFGTTLQFTLVNVFLYISRTL